MNGFPWNNHRLLDAQDFNANKEEHEKIAKQLRADIQKAIEASKKDQAMVTAWLNRYQSASGKVLEEMGFSKTPWTMGNIHEESGVSLYYYIINPEFSKDLPNNEEFVEIFDRQIQIDAERKPEEIEAKSENMNPGIGGNLVRGRDNNNLI